MPSFEIAIISVKGQPTPNGIRIGPFKSKEAAEKRLEKNGWIRSGEPDTWTCIEKGIGFTGEVREIVNKLFPAKMLPKWAV